MSNEQVLRKIEMKEKYIRIRKKESIFQGDIMAYMGSKNSTLTEPILGQKNREKIESNLLNELV